jgi:hypothetical protein
MARDDQGTTHGTGRQLLVQHTWAGLALAAVALAFHTVIDFGNQFGVDEWAIIYTLDRGSVAFANGRPLALMPIWLTYPLTGPHLMLNHALLIALKLATAFTIYLLVRHFSPDDPLFAFACGSLYLTYMIQDKVFLLDYVLIGINIGQLLFSLLALYLYFVYMAGGHPISLGGGIALAAASILMRQPSIPLLVGVPVLVFLFRRDFSRARLIGIAAWLAATLLATGYYLLPILGLAPETYSSSMFTNLNPLRMARASVVQLKFVFLNLLLTETRHIQRHQPAVVLAVAVTLTALTIIRSRLQSRPDEDGPPGGRWRPYAYWLAASIASVWLGFAAVLPTSLVTEKFSRVHFLSAAGVAVVLASLIWLISQAVRQARLRWSVRYLAIGLLVTLGVGRAGQVQQEIYYLEATWESQAYFLRSLAHLAPSVEDNTLFLYVRDKELSQVPFLAGWGYQYAIRYLFEDIATGVSTRDGLLYHEWDISDEGIEIKPQSAIRRYIGAKHSTHGWDEVIVIVKQPSGGVAILDELPPELYTEARAALYDPYARINYTFIPDRVRRLLPPLQPLYPPRTEAEMRYTSD